MENAIQRIMKHLLDSYSGKKVLVTGNTGFKGGWLSSWLQSLGADVYGYSDSVLEKPSFFEVCDLKASYDTVFGSVEDLNSLNICIQKIKPDYIFHLAAQALVQPSYANPAKTILSNAIGTMNLLECARLSDHEMNLILITSDKVYKNNEWVWGYKESDEIGGDDPYSASKGMAEIAINSYFRSFLQSKKNIRLAIGRAGNVIGGGDWAKDRIIPDCIRAWSSGTDVNIRNPFSTRPWQHVLEPVGAYLHLGSCLKQDINLNGQAFNFGPPANQNHSVQELLEELSIHLPTLSYKKYEGKSKQEAGLLKLNIDKALSLINWEPALNFSETVEFTAHWYKAHQNGTKKMHINTIEQINNYSNIAKHKGLNWIS